MRMSSMTTRRYITVERGAPGDDSQRAIETDGSRPPTNGTSYTMRPSVTSQTKISTPCTPTPAVPICDTTLTGFPPLHVYIDPCIKACPRSPGGPERITRRGPPRIANIIGLPHLRRCRRRFESVEAAAAVRMSVGLVAAVESDATAPSDQS